jgi:hypothetical protein
MSIRDRLQLPRRLSSRIWLLTLPSILASFERRQGIPRLPIGTFRFGGVPLIGVGAALAIWAWRNPQASLGYRGPGGRLSQQPATLAGLLVVCGAGLLLRSSILTAYALALAVAATTEAIEVEDPRPAELLGNMGLGSEDLPAQPDGRQA